MNWRVSASSPVRLSTSQRFIPGFRLKTSTPGGCLALSGPRPKNCPNLGDSATGPTEARARERTSTSNSRKPTIRSQMAGRLWGRFTSFGNRGERLWASSDCRSQAGSKILLPLLSVTYSLFPGRQRPAANRPNASIGIGKSESIRLRFPAPVATASPSLHARQAPSAERVATTQMPDMPKPRRLSVRYLLSIRWALFVTTRHPRCQPGRAHATPLRPGQHPANLGRKS